MPARCKPVKDPHDKQTIDAFGGPTRARGRPKSGLAKTPAERRRLARAVAAENKRRAAWRKSAPPVVTRRDRDGPIGERNKPKRHKFPLGSVLTIFRLPRAYA